MTSGNISLIDATSNSLTISWTATPGANRYVLQYCKPNTTTGSAADQFETLSDQLTAPQARKRNLSDEDGNGFFFRAGVLSADGTMPSSWLTHPVPFYLLTPDQEIQRMSMVVPKVFLGGRNATLLVTWRATPDTNDYELQMRESVAGAEWGTIAASVKGTEVRKKNLPSPHGYQFRVRPVGSSIQTFSPPSEPVVALGLSDGIKQLFRSLENGNLLHGMSPVPLVAALGGKEFVLLYASAHWCGPCRQFTPKLTQWYQSIGGLNRTVEVVFLSADHDENGFRQYYKSMPWLSVDYDDDTREALMGHIRVSGIPRLAVLDGRTGRIIEENAVGKPLDVDRWRKMLVA